MTVVIHRQAILILVLMPFYVWAATERYIIYPKEDLSLPERQQFTNELKTFAGPKGNVYTSIRRPNSLREEIRFWCADLTEEDRSQLRRHKNVLDIGVNGGAIKILTEHESWERNGTHLFRQTGGITPSDPSESEENLVYGAQVSPVARELRALSQPAAIDSVIDHYPNYVYPLRIGKTYIYHIEFGINQRHPDFENREIEWLFTETAKAGRTDTMTEAAAGEGHSTCTASKAVGKLYGASKSATLVVVKMPYPDQDSVIEALDIVIDDIEDNHREGRSVVTISWVTTAVLSREYMTSPPALRLLDQINELLSMSVVIVCAAGNEARSRTRSGELRTFVDTYPPSIGYSKTTPGHEQFFAVGNSDINGVRFTDSQQLKGLPQLYAPGVNIKCASSTSPREYNTATGTSFSAPLVAGVIADLLSTGQFTPGHPFWWRRPGGQNVVWNYVTKAQNPPVSGNGNATLFNYTSPIFATTPFSNEQLDVSTE